MSGAGKKNIYEISLKELSEFLLEKKIQPFKAKLVFQFLYKRAVDSFAAVKGLGKVAASVLEEFFVLGSLHLKGIVKDDDGSAKFLFATVEGYPIESVLMPDGDRITACVSSQSGCALACTFCATGRIGLFRNLSSGEILEQLIWMHRYALNRWNKGITNVVFMGMGEPLLNMKEVIQAIGTISAEEGFQISPRRITVSTIGLPDKMKKFVEQCSANLAVSLHAPDENRRRAIMPRAAEAAPLDDIFKTLKELASRVRRLITLEYLLIENFNDSAEDASTLASLITFRCKVNLIPYNEIPGSQWKRPSPERVRVFQKQLLDRSILTTVRESKAKGVKAACGQLGITYLQGKTPFIEGERASR